MSKNKISAEVQAIISASDAGHHATTVALVQPYLEENPNSQRAWLDLGQSLGQLARYDEAEQAYLRVIELADDESAASIFGEIGNLYRAKGNFDLAKSWYQKQIESQPNDAMGHLYLGNLLMRQGEFATAKTTFETALSCDQVCLEEAHYSLGLVNRCLGDYPAAKVHFEKALELDDRFTQAKTALKDVKSAMGHAKPNQ